MLRTVMLFATLICVPPLQAEDASGYMIGQQIWLDALISNAEITLHAAEPPTNHSAENTLHTAFFQSPDYGTYIMAALALNLSQQAQILSEYPVGNTVQNGAWVFVIIQVGSLQSHQLANLMGHLQGLY